MNEIKVKLSKRKQVKARIKAGQCLACGRTGKQMRGLCLPCYQRLRRRLASKSKAEQAEMEGRAIREGLLLGVQQVRAILSDDPFAVL